LTRTVPVGEQLVLMQACPSGDEPIRPTWQPATERLQGLDVLADPLTGEFRVKMRPTLVSILVVEEKITMP
jgi:hypothetical protein